MSHLSGLFWTQRVVPLAVKGREFDAQLCHFLIADLGARGIEFRMDSQSLAIARFGPAFGMPFTTAVLEVAHELLLLGVHGDDRLAFGLRRPDALIDVLKLRVAVGMGAALAGFDKSGIVGANKSGRREEGG